MRVSIFKFVAAIFALAVVPIAMAGTPLICFPFDIGAARSLPWTPDKGLGSPNGDYDIARLADDTIAILNAETPVIVRMETMRRAVLYGQKNAAAGQQLLERLKVRATAGAGKRGALALFDYGYLLETMKQVNPNKSAASPNGYEYVLKALQLSGNEPEMEFAAALITLWPKHAGHEEHLHKAVAGAEGDSLLARNLISHFPAVAGTLADPHKSAAASARKR